MLKFQQLARLLFVVAALNSVQANKASMLLKHAFEARFHNVDVTEILVDCLNRMRNLVRTGNNIPAPVLDQYQVVMDFISDGTNIETSPARLVGGGNLTKKPDLMPEPNDYVIKELEGVDVQEICQKCMWEFAAKAAPALEKYASDAEKSIKHIEVGVVSVGYKGCKETYNIGLFKVTLKP